MPFVGIGVGIGRQRFAQGGIFAAYAARVAADGGTTEAGACVNAVSGISLDSSLLLVPSGYKSGVVYSEIPTNGDGDLTFTRASDATRVNSDGEIEVVGSGVPRLDYSQGSCPALLLEPQRTNLALYSEEFDNASWTKFNSTIVANNAISPSGVQDADLIYPTTTGSTRFAFQSVSGANTTYTLSVYAKAQNKSVVWLYINSSGTFGSVFFDLTNGTLQVVAGSTSTPVGKIEYLNNGWYKCSITPSSTFSLSNAGIGVADTLGNFTVSNNGTDGLFIWGAQVEQGAYATSYIPTTSATVTRLADVCSKTGISSLIGQTEGTLFAEVDISNIGLGWILDASDGTATNRTLFFKLANNQIRFFRNSATQSSSTSVDSPILSLGVHKIALAYKSGNTAFFIDGVQISTTNTATFTNGTLNKISLGIAGDGSGNELGDSISKAIVYKTRLTNTQLAELTTL